MGQHNAKFPCLLWHNKKSLWVPTVVSLSHDRLLCYNARTKQFIAAMRLMETHKLCLFGPLCSKADWLPEVSTASHELNLLAIPSSNEALSDFHQFYWFYLETAVLVSLLEASLVVLKKKQKRQSSSRVARPNSSAAQVDLSQWYSEGFCSGWHIGSAENAKLSLQNETRAAVVKVSDWCSKFDPNWDQSGDCLLYDVSTGKFTRVQSNGFRSVTQPRDTENGGRRRSSNKNSTEVGGGHGDGHNNGNDGNGGDSGGHAACGGD